MRGKNLLKSLVLPRNPKQAVLARTPAGKKSDAEQLLNSITSLEASDEDFYRGVKSCVLELSDLSVSAIDLTQDNSACQRASELEEMERKITKKEKEIEQLVYEKGLFAAQHKFNHTHITRLARELAAEKEKNADLRRQLGRSRQTIREQEAKMRFLEERICRNPCDATPIQDGSKPRSVELMETMASLDAELSTRLMEIKRLLGSK